MPNRSIEIHDSVLNEITSDGPNVILTFSSVYIHQSDGEPGWDAGSGWVQEARLYIADAAIVGTFSTLPWDLWDGAIRLDEKLSENAIPIPLDFRGKVQLDLQGNESLQISGTHIHLELIGEAKYIEEFSGNP